MSIHEKLVWHPSRGTLIEFGNSGPFRLLSPGPEGMDTTQSRSVTQSVPGQHGTTLIDIEVGERTIAVPVAIRAKNRASLTDLRGQLIKALTALPVRVGQRPRTGLLRYHRANGHVVEIEAVPQNSPQITQQQETWLTADLEFVCAYPYWRAIQDSWIEITTAEIGYEINNIGDVPAPVVIRIYGENDTPNIINETMNQQIKINDTIPDEHYVEIQTGFGQKSVQLVDPDGSRTNWMSRININESSFWHLMMDSNIIRFESLTDPPGITTISWRPRWAGI